MRVPRACIVASDPSPWSDSGSTLMRSSPRQWGSWRRGVEFTAGDVTDEVLDGYTERFDAVGDKHRRQLQTHGDRVNWRRLALYRYVSD